VPHIAHENPAPMTHLLDGPIHELLHLKNLSSGSLRLLVLRGENQRRQVDAEHALAVHIPCGGSLFAADFDRSEWEIMYPLSVEEGPIDPSEHVS
jgi:hypothetical protein